MQAHDRIETLWRRRSLRRALPARQRLWHVETIALIARMWIGHRGNHALASIRRWRRLGLSRENYKVRAHKPCFLR